MSGYEYPARLIVSRPPTTATPEPFVMIDDRILLDAAEAAERVRVYQFGQAAYRTGPIYSYTVAPVAEAEATAARIRAELANEKGAGTATNSPAPEAPTSGTHAQPQDTTKAAGRQVVLIVAYETDQAGSLGRVHSAGELVSLKVDGQEAKPPTRNLSELYRLLQARGYNPAGFQWLERATGGRRQRRQVYAQAAS